MRPELQRIQRHLQTMLKFVIIAMSVPCSADGWHFPREQKLDEGLLVVHAPQIVSWDDFEKASLLIALEFTPLGSETAVVGSISLVADTTVDLVDRMVHVSNPLVKKVNLLGDMDDHVELFQAWIKQDRFEVPLDIFLVSVAQDVLLNSDAPAFNTQAPQIHVVSKPTILLYIDGEPVADEMEWTGLRVVINANWPLVHDPQAQQYYLLNKDTWLTSADLSGPWIMADTPPHGLNELSPEGAFANFMVAQTGTRQADVLFTREPSELIVIEGAPILEAIPGTGNLKFVTNTQSPLFNVDGRWYFLSSGRWFSSEDLNRGSWEFETSLPDSFKQIPQDHGMSFVRSSVAGTLESKIALVEASLPQKKEISRNTQLDLTIDYDGQPAFSPISGTTVERAENTSYDVVSYNGVYYLCFEGAWYQSDSPVGIWTVTTEVPDSIYLIPPSSPSYSVTQVKVESATPTTVVYSATPAYTTGIYIAYGVPVYGTGWYYPPYHGIHYYPRFTTYGSGSYYNPRTGTYATRSVAYGPYGGYSYTEASNPRSGRTGYIETAWDNDEWASYGETYNPRTNVQSETTRYYSEETQRFEMEREISRGDNSMTMQREYDVDDGWSTTDRQGSEGGSSHVERQRQEDGSWSASGTGVSADGRTADYKAGVEDGIRKSQITGSDGGEIVSMRDGQDRFTVGQDSQGDLYAGHNGEVYKKGDDGWYQYDRESGDWQEHAQEQTARSTTENRRTNVDRSSQSARGTTTESSSRTRSDQFTQLDRDAKARQHGYDQFEQRRGYSSARSTRGSSRRGRR